MVCFQSINQSQFQAHSLIGDFSLRIELVADCCKSSVAPLREHGRAEGELCVCVESLEERRQLAVSSAAVLMCCAELRYEYVTCRITLLLKTSVESPGSYLTTAGKVKVVSPEAKTTSVLEKKRFPNHGPDPKQETANPMLLSLVAKQAVPVSIKRKKQNHFHINILCNIIDFFNK